MSKVKMKKEISPEVARVDAGAYMRETKGEFYVKLALYAMHDVRVLRESKDKRTLANWREVPSPGGRARKTPTTYGGRTLCYASKAQAKEAALALASTVGLPEVVAGGRVDLIEAVGALET